MRRIAHVVAVIVLVALVTGISTVVHKIERHEPFWFITVDCWLLVMIIGGLVRLLGAAVSKNIRASIARHPIIHAVWLSSSAALLAVLLFGPKVRPKLSSLHFTGSNKTLQATAAVRGSSTTL